MTSMPHIHTVGLIGFGQFGKLIARHLSPHVPLVICDPALPPDAISGANQRSGDLATAAGCPLVILAVPVHTIGSVCSEIRTYLQPGAIVADVGSVKLEPVQIMQSRLPDHVDLVGTHPLFGPQSARAGLAGHKIALCNIRGRSHLPLAAFLRTVLGLQVILTTAEQHDIEAATVQGLTHLIARTLSDMGPLPARMTTASFDRLVEAVQMVQGDPPAVFAAIAEANPFAAKVREDFLRKAGAVVGALDAELP